MLGIAPMTRLQQLYRQLAPQFDGERVLHARDQAPAHAPFDPIVEEGSVGLHDPGQYLENGRSVIVLGVRIPRGTMEVTIRTPAEAVGPLAFAQYESRRLLELAGLRVVKMLRQHGYRSVLTHDLLGSASWTANPRGPQNDLLANRFAAWAAGLGRIARSGQLIHSRFGGNLCFLAIVTDADLPGDEVVREDAFLAPCRTECGEQCRLVCPTAALGCERVRFELEGIRETFYHRHRLRCDWAKRYSLAAAEGNAYMGWMLDVPIPKDNEITPQVLAEALREQPPTPKYRPCNAERCLLACPYVRDQGTE
ncbi:MAG: hypothetical protein D6820_02890 [Lentisphaerae bacterium]|nr:MAG: hypothetical protein D6820_02890 [Lentisphaerota bacterium]